MSLFGIYISAVATSQSVAAAGSSRRGNGCNDGVRVQVLQAMLCKRDHSRRLFFEMELKQALQLSQAHQ